jgi:gamma-glutamyltranspeptidase/glutathione hydrolase
MSRRAIVRFGMVVLTGSTLVAQEAPRRAEANAGAGRVAVERQLTSSRGAVACVERLAAKVGAEVLADGGNAVDAAIATAFALAVTYPEAGNLGGGGFMLVAMADGRTAAIDYRETAPRHVDERLFLDTNGAIDPLKSELGPFVVGVPGTVAGLELAHRRFGSLPWSRLVEPARRLADEGFEVGPVLAQGLRDHAKELRRFPATAAQFFRVAPTRGSGDVGASTDSSSKAELEPYAVGERLVQRDLANTLRWIEEGGETAFYDGPIAALIAAEMRRAGAPMDEHDLASYRAVEREVLTTTFRGHELLLMPPPSSGGVALAQILGLLEPLDLRRDGRFDDRARHLFAEAERRAFADRAQFLGDPEAGAVPVRELLSREHLDALRATIDADHATRSDSLGPPVRDLEPAHTTHFSVVDAAGNAVANTYTIEDWYGSGLVAPGTGFLLNNELHDFNVKPGLTDRAGHVGTSPNLVRPGRRPLSSMTPCIVRRRPENGGASQVELVTGSPGGRTIISSVAMVLLDVLEFGESLEQAVALPRQHHGWFPDELVVEPTLDAATRAALERRGHRLVEPKSHVLGDTHSIARDPKTGRVEAVADRRIDGWVGAPLEK